MLAVIKFVAILAGMVLFIMKMDKNPALAFTGAMVIAGGILV